MALLSSRDVKVAVLTSLLSYLFYNLSTLGASFSDVKSQVLFNARSSDTIPIPLPKNKRTVAVVQVLGVGNEKNKIGKYLLNHKWVTWQWLLSILSLHQRLEILIDKNNNTLPEIDHVVMYDSWAFDEESNKTKKILEDNLGIKFISHSNQIPIIKNATASKEYWPGVFMKMTALQLEEYSKVLILDLDTLLWRGLDYLILETKCPSMAVWNAPDEFNSGVFVVCPSIAVYERMIHALSDLNETSRDERTDIVDAARRDPSKGSLENDLLNTDSYSDQGFFSSFYSNPRLSPGESLNYLPYTYNVRFQNLDDKTFQWKYFTAYRWWSINIIHFTPCKPWDGCAVDLFNDPNDNKIWQRRAVCAYYKSARIMNEKKKSQLLFQNYTILDTWYKRCTNASVVDILQL